MRRQSDVFFGERESGQDVRQTNGAWSDGARGKTTDGRRRVRLLLKDLCVRALAFDRADYDDDRWVVQTRRVRRGEYGNGD